MDLCLNDCKDNEKLEFLISHVFESRELQLKQIGTFILSDI